LVLRNLFLWFYFYFYGLPLCHVQYVTCIWYCLMLKCMNEIKWWWWWWWWWFLPKMFQHSIHGALAVVQNQSCEIADLGHVMSDSWFADAPRPADTTESSLAVSWMTVYLRLFIARHRPAWQMRCLARLKCLKTDLLCSWHRKPTVSSLSLGN